MKKAEKDLYLFIGGTHHGTTAHIDRGLERVAYHLYCPLPVTTEEIPMETVCGIEHYRKVLFATPSGRDVAVFALDDIAEPTVSLLADAALRACHVLGD